MRPSPHHRVLVAGVCGLVLTVGLARFAYTPLLPIMQAQAGLTRAAGGWLATLNYAGYMAGTVLAAAAMGRRAPKRALYRAGLLIAVLSTAGMGMTGNVATWAVLRFAAGLSSAGGMLLGSGMVLDWLARHGRRPELGVHFAGMGLGVAASGLAVALTAGVLGWAQQWLALGALGLVLLVPAWAWMPAPASVAAGDEPRSPRRTPQARPEWLLIAAYFCAGFGYVVSATFLVAVVEQQPALAGSGGAVWVTVGLAATPACLAWDYVARRTGEVPALLLAYAAQIASILLAALAGNVATALLGAALYGATFIGIVGQVLALVGRHHPENPSAAMARLTLSYGAAQMLAPALAGTIAEATGSYQGALYLAAGVMAAGMAPLALLQRRAGASPPSAALW